MLYNKENNTEVFFMMNEVKERMRLFPAIDKDGYKRLERLIDLNKGKLSEIEQGRLKAELK